MSFKLSHERGFTLIELLVVVAIVAILAGILMPVFARAKAASHSANCMSNLKQLGIAVKAYCNDHQDRMPTIDTLFEQSMSPGYDPDADAAKLSPSRVLEGYIVDTNILTCPAAVNGLPYAAGQGRWSQTYVFYGRDYTRVLYGSPQPWLNYDQFNGQVQQTVEAHMATSAESGVVWVRDSISRISRRKVKFPHGESIMNRLYSDGHVSRVSPEPHALAADF